MNTKIAALLVALMASLPVSYASASDTLKVGYVNTQRIFRDAPTAVKAAKKIEAEFSKRDQDLQRRSADLQRSDDGMRGAITSANSASTGRRAAGTCPAADAEADDAATARALLGTCTGRYRAMAEDAAGLATQVTDLQDHVVVVQPEAAALLEESP